MNSKPIVHIIGGNVGDLEDFKFKCQVVDHDLDIRPHDENWDLDFNVNNSVVLNNIPEKSRVIIATSEKWIKKEIIRLLEWKNVQYINVIHPEATISKNATLGKGNIIGKECIINDYVSIGDFNIIEKGCTFHEYSYLSDYSYVDINQEVESGKTVNKCHFKK
jgi:NDP-sugar pyrophosphorylase family protein